MGIYSLINDSLGGPPKIRFGWSQIEESDLLNYSSQSRAGKMGEIIGVLNLNQ